MRAISVVLNNENQETGERIEDHDIKAIDDDR